MQVEETLQRHEERLQEQSDDIKRHDKEIGRLGDAQRELQQHMNDTFTRIEESNKFLREQNTRQGEQNEKILNAVLEKNEKSEARAYDLKKVSQENFWKMVFGIGGSAALIWTAIQQILKII